MDTRQEQLEQRVRYQRREMEGTIDEIGERISPKAMYERRKQSIRDRVTDWRERVMGSSDYGYPDQGMGSDGESRLSQAADAVTGAPDMIRQQTRGNPLAAGLIAFGAGLLAGSVLPETRAERQAVQKAEPQMRQVADEAKEMARDIGEDVKQSAQAQAEELKESAMESAERVKEGAQEGAQSVRDDAQESARRMQT